MNPTGIFNKNKASRLSKAEGMSVLRKRIGKTTGSGRQVEEFQRPMYILEFVAEASHCPITKWNFEILL